MTDSRHTLTAIAAILEQTGREIILPAFHAAIHTSSKSDGSIVTTTDLDSQRFIQSKLAALDAGIAFLGEEMRETDQLACLADSHGQFWCLDPLDGTSNFAAHFPAFAISLALIEGGMVQLACIHDPVRHESFTAIARQGAWLNGRAISSSAGKPLQESVGFVDFKRLKPTYAAALATKPCYRSQRNIGSCALEWAWLAAGRGQFIIHGGEKLWDFAAGSLIAAEAGCIVGDFNGAPLFPARTLSSPVLAASDSQIQASLKLQLED